MGLIEVISGAIKPLASIVNKRQDRKMAKESAKAKLAQAKVDGAQQISLNKDEYEVVATQGLTHTWKDEYATVSVISIMNIVVIGGVLAGFGHNQMLEGVVIAVQALVAIGVDVGFLLTAAVLSALGLSIWKRA